MQTAACCWRNQVLGWVKAGLRDFSISRSAAAMSWGIPLPQDASHNTYVWCASGMPVRWAA
jgi:methionyl-tRNA synthetase